jgi:uncharacterized protein DUF2513
VQQPIEEGLVEGVVVRDREGVPSRAAIIRLTSKGHDFVDATRNQNFWINTKTYVTKSLPGWRLSILKEVAERATKVRSIFDALPRRNPVRARAGDSSNLGRAVSIPRCSQGWWFGRKSPQPWKRGAKSAPSEVDSD